MNVHEMEGFLRGKCLPGDLKVNESNAEYLVRKLNAVGELKGELTAALATIEKCREVSGCPAGVDLQDHLEQLAAENVGLIRSAECLLHEASEVYRAYNKTQLPDGDLVDGQSLQEVWDAINATPATDRIVAGIKADGVEKAQQRNGELETYSKTALEFREAARDENRHLKLELEIAEKRITELEFIRTLTAATADVLAERKRQVSVEGWTPSHDDTHKNNEMAFAAACYAFHAAAASWDLEDCGTEYDSHPAPKSWPWEPEWWKPKSARADLVRAGALILAEIERIDRADSIKWEAE